MLILAGSDEIKLLSDSDLIFRYKNSNNSLYIGELYKRYTQFVFFICMKYLKNEERSQEAVMQIFEKLIDSLKRFDVDNFKPWLHSVAKNHCLLWIIDEAYDKKKIEEMKKNSGSVMESEEFLYLDIENDKELKLKLLEECMKELKQEQKLCVELFFLQEKCYNEITEATGYDYNKVKSYIQNGKRNLKNCIESKYAG
ncbi:MAG: sigma-70 family RNA polymerase sigma factor [Bacteroidia bacterium]|nr:sigma-70 family RNA polymerase sigma factor [Bacteroidia bacterium]